jgi:hypothetical protein
VYKSGNVSRFRVEREATAMPKLTHEEAAKKLTDAGITWSSSGNCSDRKDKRCTSFEQVNSTTVDGIIAFKKACGCDINITGGTEVGHASGTQSHWNGFKVDITPSPCVSNFIKTNFDDVGKRGDGAQMYKDASGNIFARETSHWDITFPG